MQHRISNHTFKIFEYFQYEKQKMRDNFPATLLAGQTNYISMHETCFKLTVKYMSIYTVLQDSKGNKAICNIPLNPIR